MLNDKNAKNIVNWSSKRNNEERLRHRPHVVTSANNRDSLYTRYFSSIDADIYFGDRFIDEVTSISWQLQQNTMPIFGYNSSTFDDIAIGNRIISGQFSINFVQSNFLQKAISTLRKINRQMYGEDLPAKSAFSDSDRKRRNLPIWDAGFDILVGYGEKSGDSYEQIVILDCCQITGCAQQLDVSGQPVQEIYSFIARDIKFSEVSSNSNNSNNINDNAANKVPNATPEQMTLKSANIDVSNSNSSLVVIFDTSDDAEIVGGCAKLNIKTDSFNMAKEFTIKSNNLSLNFTSKEKQDILNFCSEFNTDKVDADLVIALALPIETKTINKRIVANVKI